MRVVAISLLATLLGACSGSDRVERIVPAWANAPARAAPHYAARKDRAEDHGKPIAEPQPTKSPGAQDHSEE
jgi:hypothetical protein